MLPAQPVPTSARSARSFPPRRAAGGAAPRPRAADPLWGGRCRCRPATPRGQIGTRGSAAPGGRGLRERRGGPLRRRRSEAPRSQEAAAGGRCPSVVFDSPCNANRCAVLLYRARMARPAASSRKRLKYLLHSLLATFCFFISFGSRSPCSFLTAGCGKLRAACLPEATPVASTQGAVGVLPAALSAPRISTGCPPECPALPRQLQVAVLRCGSGLQAFAVRGRKKTGCSL